MLRHRTGARPRARRFRGEQEETEKREKNQASLEGKRG